MKNMIQKMKAAKKNNKGFSLVELIVVIAIMAVLVGILAPQFIKYVENSRKATDVKNGQEIASAILTAMTDQEGVYKSSQSTITAITTTNLPSGLGSIPDIKTTAITTKTWSATWDVDKGTVVVYCGGTDATHQVYPTAGTVFDKK